MLHDHTQERHLHQIFEKLTKVRKCMHSSLTFHGMVCLVSSTSPSVPPGWPYQRACHVLFSTPGKIQCSLLLCHCPEPRTMPGTCIQPPGKGSLQPPCLCMEGKGQCCSRAALPRGWALFPASQQHRPPTPSRKGIPAWRCLFPKAQAEQPLRTALHSSVWGAPDKMCQNLPKRALSCRRHQWLKAVCEMHSRSLGKKKGFLLSQYQL